MSMILARPRRRRITYRLFEQKNESFYIVDIRNYIEVLREVSRYLNNLFHDGIAVTTDASYITIYDFVLY